MSGVLDEWVNRSGMVIDAMGHFDLGDRLTLDYSGESLGRVAVAVCERVAEPAELLGGEERSFAEGVVAYVGESLLRRARGRWEWDAAPGFADRGRPALGADVRARVDHLRWHFEGVEAAGVPVVAAHPALPLVAASPLHLVLAQVGHSGPGPGPIVAAFESWGRVVDVHSAAHPEWHQVSAPVLTSGMPIMPPSPILDTWLVERRRAFPRWADAHGGVWDFTAPTLDQLAALVFRVTPTMAAFEDPANAEFSEGAAWYFGEVLCRVVGARWLYRAHLVEPGDPRAVAFTVQTVDDADFTGPFVRISNMLRRGDPGWLRRGYDQWVDHA